MAAAADVPLSVFPESWKEIQHTNLLDYSWVSNLGVLFPEKMPAEWRMICAGKVPYGSFILKGPSCAWGYGKCRCESCGYSPETRNSCVERHTIGNTAVYYSDLYPEQFRLFAAHHAQWHDAKLREERIEKEVDRRLHAMREAEEQKEIERRVAERLYGRASAAIPFR
jgi:hypothetical protein